MLIIVVAVMPFVSMGLGNGNYSKSHDLSSQISSTDDDWTRVGTTVIYKKISGNVMASQTVPVYKNSDGERAIKDGSYYRKFEENPMFHRYPTDECAECDYYYRVIYEGGMWYTYGIVKQSY